MSKTVSARLHDMQQNEKGVHVFHDNREKPLNGIKKSFRKAIKEQA
jgi:hypothetical protein